MCALNGRTWIQIIKRPAITEVLHQKGRFSSSASHLWHIVYPNWLTDQIPWKHWLIFGLYSGQLYLHFKLSPHEVAAMVAKAYFCAAVILLILHAGFGTPRRRREWPAGTPTTSNFSMAGHIRARKVFRSWSCHGSRKKLLDTRAALSVFEMFVHYWQQCFPHLYSGFVPLDDSSLKVLLHEWLVPVFMEYSTFAVAT